MSGELPPTVDATDDPHRGVRDGLTPMNFATIGVRPLDEIIAKVVETIRRTHAEGQTHLVASIRLGPSNLHDAKVTKFETPAPLAVHILALSYALRRTLEGTELPAAKVDAVMRHIDTLCDQMIATERDVAAGTN